MTHYSTKTLKVKNWPNANPSNKFQEMFTGGGITYLECSWNHKMWRNKPPERLTKLDSCREKLSASNTQCYRVTKHRPSKVSWTKPWDDIAESRHQRVEIYHVNSNEVITNIETTEEGFMKRAILREKPKRNTEWKPHLSRCFGLIRCALFVGLPFWGREKQ